MCARTCRRRAGAKTKRQMQGSRRLFAAVKDIVAPVDGSIEIDLVARCVRVRGIVDGTTERDQLSAHLRAHFDRSLARALRLLCATLCSAAF